MMLVKGTPGNRDVLSHAFIKSGQLDLWIRDQLRKPNNIAPEVDKFGICVMNKSPHKTPNIIYTTAPGIPGHRVAQGTNMDK